MAVSHDTPLALANRFWVKVMLPGEIDLGSWAKVDGLDVTFDVAEYRAGDAWNERWYAPGITKYSTIKLSRVVTKDDHKLVHDWLSKTATEHKPGLMVIELRDSSGLEVTTWEMRSAMPAKWSVVGFDAGISKVATEQLEVVHMGFLDDEKKS
jgi:phage tail-like protein